MKKLNKKGFTLIELLAVIVILAVVMVVTIPSVLNSMSSAKTTQLKNAADAVSEWLGKQRELDELGSIGGTVSSLYTGAKASLNTATSDAKYNLSDDILKAAGFSGGNADATGSAYYNTTKKKYCVTLTPPSASVKFKGISAQTTSGC